MRHRLTSRLVIAALAVLLSTSTSITSSAMAADVPLSLKLTSRGYNLLRDRQQGAAIPVLMQAVIADPGNLAARRLLAQAQLLTGKPLECLEQMRAVATVQPNVPSDLFLVAQAFIALGKTQEAGDLLTRVLQANPNHTQALLSMIDIHMSLGQYGQASVLCKRVLVTAKNSLAIETATQKLSLIEQCAQTSEHHPG
jgi:Flp pilus assembly protein TadD